jgi:hypothetical protein
MSVACNIYKVQGEDVEKVEDVVAILGHDAVRLTSDVGLWGRTKCTHPAEVCSG